MNQVGETGRTIERYTLVGETLPTNPKQYRLFWLTGASPALYGCFVAGTWVKIAGSGGSTPGDPDGSVQFNNAGAFGGSADLSWDNINKILSIATVGHVAGQQQVLIGPDFSTGGAVEISSGNDMAVLSTALEVIASDNNGSNAGTFSAMTVRATSTHAIASGTVGHLYGIETFVNSTGSGTTTNAINILIHGIHQGSGGVITNNYGISIEDQVIGSNNWAIKTGLGLVDIGDSLKLNADITLPFVMKKNTQAATAPSAGFACLRWEAGTNANTAKLVAYAGTSSTGVTIVDNVGAGF